jgi:hypothetical protein
MHGGLRGLTFELTGPRRRDGLARAGENVPRTARPGQDSPPLGVRWFSEWLGGARWTRRRSHELRRWWRRLRSWRRGRANQPATAVGAPGPEPVDGGSATEGEQICRRTKRPLPCGSKQMRTPGQLNNCELLNSGPCSRVSAASATVAVWLTPNVGAKRPDAAGRRAGKVNDRQARPRRPCSLP